YSDQKGTMMPARQPNNLSVITRLFGGAAPGPEAVLAQVQQADEVSGAVVAAAMAVQAELGGGFLVEVYQEALAIELSARNISCERDQEVAVAYKGQALNARLS